MALQRRSLSVPVGVGMVLVLTAAGAMLNVGLDGVASAATGPVDAAAVTQVSSTPAQTIQNIGASGAWWVNDLVHFSSANQQRVAQLLFSPSGI